MHFSPQFVQLITKALEDLAGRRSWQSADNRLVDLLDAAPVARNAFLDAGVDHLHDVAAKQRQALLGDLECLLLGLHGLRELLDGLSLSDLLPMASTWCKEQGLDSLDELREAEMEAELVDALGLKPGKAKILLKRLKEQ